MGFFRDMKRRAKRKLGMEPEPVPLIEDLPEGVQDALNNANTKLDNVLKDLPPNQRYMALGGIIFAATAVLIVASKMLF